MKKISLVLLAMLIFSLGAIMYLRTTKASDSDEGLLFAPIAPAEAFMPTPEPTQTPEPSFSEATLCFLGDNVIHDELNAQSRMSDGSFDFYPIYRGLTDVVSSADYAACTIEGGFMENGMYSGYPMFKTPEDITDAFVETGFDLINTASNHCMDGLQNSLYHMLDVFDEHGLDHVGTYRSADERNENNGIVVREINGISVAFLSYTYGTNGIYISNFPYAVNTMFKDYTSTRPYMTNYDGMAKDMAVARELGTDIIVAMLHWGYEYHIEQDAYQEEIADFFFAEGADIIIGGHPHVPQPLELRHVVDNEGNEKNCFIVYSLGNLASSMNDDYTFITAAINILVEKNMNTGKAYLKQVAYKPLVMIDYNDYGMTSDNRFELWDTRQAIEELGAKSERLNDGLIGAVEDINMILDPKFDEINGGIDVTAWTA